MSTVHGTFLWRGKTMGVRGCELVEYKEANPVTRFTFPSPIARAWGITQNVCIVVLEDGTIWQYLGEHTTRLVPLDAVLHRVTGFLDDACDQLRRLMGVAAAATPPKEGP